MYNDVCQTTFKPIMIIEDLIGELKQAHLCSDWYFSFPALLLYSNGNLFTSMSVSQ